MGEAFIYDHVRTPRGRGRSDGALHQITPISLASQVLKALRQRNKFDPASIQDVGLGVVMPIGEQGADLTRFALLDAGYGDGVPGYQINRYCTSSLDAINHAAASIMAGTASAIIAGGVESMSRIAIGSDGGACYIFTHIQTTDFLTRGGFNIAGVLATISLAALWQIAFANFSASNGGAAFAYLPSSARKGVIQLRSHVRSKRFRQAAQHHKQQKTYPHPGR